MTVVPAQVTTVEDRIIGNLGFSQILLLIVPVFASAFIFGLFPPFMGGALYKYIIMASVANPRYWKPGLYHFSNEGVCSWYDFACAIFRMAGISCNVEPVESKDFLTLAIRPHFSVLNKSRFKSAFGLEIPYWMDSLEKCILWLKNEKRT